MQAQFDFKDILELCFQDKPGSGSTLLAKSGAEPYNRIHNPGFGGLGGAVVQGHSRTCGFIWIKTRVRDCAEQKGGGACTDDNKV